MCTVETCDRPVRTRGYCSRHYYKVLKYGDPLAGGTRYKTPEESFANRTKQDGECLIWTGTTNGKYGLISIGQRKEELAHRYAWKRVHGPIPDGLWIDHMCHMPRCVNVDHLRLATPKQNNENSRGAHSDNKSSGVRGVSWDKSRNKWMAYIGHNGKLRNLGRYDDLAEATEVARQARLRLFTHNLHDRITSEAT